MVRSEAEIQTRLVEAVEARKSLLSEELQAEDGTNTAMQHELSQEIANLSGVITTLEWVLQTGTSIEDEAWAEETDEGGDDLIEIAAFTEGDMPPAVDAETRPTR